MLFEISRLTKMLHILLENHQLRSEMSLKHLLDICILILVFIIVCTRNAEDFHFYNYSYVPFEPIGRSGSVID